MAKNERGDKIEVKDTYFKMQPGLMSGRNLAQYEYKYVRFVNCTFHPVCWELLGAMVGQEFWEVVNE